MCEFCCLAVWVQVAAPTTNTQRIASRVDTHFVLLMNCVSIITIRLIISRTNRYHTNTQCTRNYYYYYKVRIFKWNNIAFYRDYVLFYATSPYLKQRLFHSNNTQRHTYFVDEFHFLAQPSVFNFCFVVLFSFFGKFRWHQLAVTVLFFFFTLTLPSLLKKIGTLKKINII